MTTKMYGVGTGKEAAFPLQEYPQMGSSISVGLTKREYMATMAMQGLWASVKSDNYDNYDLLAEMAVKQADALLHHLSKP